MEILTKNDIILETSKITGLSESDVKDTFDTIIDVITQSLVHGKQCRIAGFMTLASYNVGSRPYTHIKTREKLIAPPKTHLRVKSGDKLKRLLNS